MVVDQETRQRLGIVEVLSATKKKLAVKMSKKEGTACPKHWLKDALARHPSYIQSQCPIGMGLVL